MAGKRGQTTKENARKRSDRSTRTKAESQQTTEHATLIVKSESKPAAPTTETRTQREAYERVDAEWKVKCIPTLYTFFGAAIDVWGTCCISAASIAQVQEIIDVAVPNSGYRVRHRDTFFKKSHARLNEKRTHIGKQALGIVDKFYSSAEFLGKPDAIRSHALWALHKHGPMLYRKPTPVHCIESSMRSRAADYVQPEGHFLSSFFIDLMQYFFRFTRGTRGEFGPPKGVLCLATTALERAFRSWLTGTKVTPPEFTQDMYKTATDDYKVSILELTDQQWYTIRQEYGDPRLPAVPAPLKPKFTRRGALETSRRRLFLPSSSPAPGPEDLDPEVLFAHLQ
ncbi:hypothetical protein CONPUDRAFT_158393 [Coniophora puteana RWD-64-598 SS2]|uniref:DUF6532 domain-containing protein n=1 Tax=Coniophora puteana (strain RWD-64-598) TaxID=741705 RepID=A0A5M3MAW6_CONPW|nr:uncharacterized protein CONPUDRAFT_158393 [Coniophora puteana RWD-64-598 SS2]EIW76369.1 hypothetical protein CONPUDRAFT_158393 [Coniophora puteana RWD-64-598 SS2]